MNQQIVWQADYQPFGKTNVSVNLVINNVRFPGQYFDEESGLHYNYFRDYDPSIGRYLKSDPIGLAGGPNTYAYVSQNPVNFVDPRGEVGFATGAFGFLVGAVGGAASAIAAGESATNVVVSGFAGAVTGGIVGAVNPAGLLALSSRAALAITGAATGASSNIAAQSGVIALDPNKTSADFSPGSVVAAAAAGGLAFPAGNAARVALTGSGQGLLAAPGGALAGAGVDALVNTGFAGVRQFLFEEFLQPPGAKFRFPDRRDPLCP